MIIDKEKLIELAEAACQGRWVQDGFEVQNDDVEDYCIANCRSVADAAFISAVDPVTILALAEEADQLKTENEKMRSFLAEVSRTSGDKWAVMAARNLLKEFSHD